MIPLTEDRSPHITSRMFSSRVFAILFRKQSLTPVGSTANCVIMLGIVGMSYLMYPIPTSGYSIGWIGDMATGQFSQLESVSP